MTSGSLGLRVGSYGSLHSPSNIVNSRRASSKMLVTSRDNNINNKERFFPFVFRFFCRKNVAMLLLVALALLVFVFGSFTVSKESTDSDVEQSRHPEFSANMGRKYGMGGNTAPPSQPRPAAIRRENHPCLHYIFPPPPPPDQRRPGPRPCEVCYLPVDLARASMPISPSMSPLIRNLNYVVDEQPEQTEPHGGSDFGGYPSLKQRNESFEIQESMTVHCGFVRGSIPGHQTGFDIDEDDLVELQKPRKVIVASAIFGKYDELQHPENVSEEAKRDVPFFMFIDVETEAYMRVNGTLNSTMRVGLWRIIVVRNVPYTDARRNGKVPKLLLHRILPNVRYSIWIDGKLKLLVDPYKILERFLWRENSNFAISRHYKRFNVFEEAEANKAGAKYDNTSIDYQIEFYKREGLTEYTEAKLPITSDVPEGCVIIREHIPITNLFTCLWFNEVDRFTSRDQLSFSTVRDKIMAQVDWSIYMFEDCERRNFVNQTHHREYMEYLKSRPPPLPRQLLPSRNVGSPGRPQVKNSSRHRRPGGSKRHRKVAMGNRDKQFPLLARAM